MDTGLWITVIALACMVLSVAITMLMRKKKLPDFRERRRQGRGRSE